MKIVRLIVVFLVFCSQAAFALTPDEVAEKLTTLKIPVTEVRDSGVDGLYEVLVTGGQSLFVTTDGSHLLTGDLFQVTNSGFVNQTEVRRNAWRKDLMDGLKESEMVVFAPPAKDLKATVTVFTDIDCGYCRKLHQDIPQLNKMGIAVRYLAYPRAGLDSHSYEKYVSAWCADDPAKALTLAKNGGEPEPRVCANPVAAQYKLGGEVGVSGTPALVYSDGTIVMGYRGAEALGQDLGVLN